MYGNKITGTLPESFGWLKHLTHVSLSSNNLRGTLPYFRYISPNPNAL
jgi:hypothetical protein